MKHCMLAVLADVVIDDDEAKITTFCLSKKYKKSNVWHNNNQEE